MTQDLITFLDRLKHPEDNSPYVRDHNGSIERIQGILRQQPSEVSITGSGSVHNAADSQECCCGKDPYHELSCTTHLQQVQLVSKLNLSSEIPVVDDVLKAIRQGLNNRIPSYRMGDQLANPFLYGEDHDKAQQIVSVYNEIRPYLRTPVPVSIEAAVTKLMENAEEYSAPVNKFRAMRFAQICAKTWGLSHE